MKLKTVKRIAELPCIGVKIDAAEVDGSLRSIRLTGPDGKFIVIQAGESYSRSLQILIAEPPKAEDRWFVTGSFMGVAQINEPFEDEFQANTRLGIYEEKAGHQETGLTVEKRSVLISTNDGDGGVSPASAYSAFGPDC